MPTISRVTLSVEETCKKCEGKLNIGEIVVKDKREKKKAGKTVYWHTKCYTK